MSTIYRSTKGHILLDSRGFFELIAAEGCALEQTDIHVINDAIVRSGLSNVSFLISRFNKYSVPADFNILNFANDLNFDIDNVAYFAPSPADQTYSCVMRMTAFRDVISSVFFEREEAISWLLADTAEQGAAANPYPLRGRVEVTPSGSSPLPGSLPPYQGG